MSHRSLMLSTALLFASFVVLADAGQAASLDPRAVTDDRPRSEILIPSAGSLQGGGGTYFRSDVTLANRRDVPQTVLVTWLPRNGEGPKTATLELAPFEIVTITDFVAEVLDTSGLGAILLTTVTAGTTTEDRFGQIDAFSRIWTPQPGTNGTVSQQFSAIDPQVLDRKKSAMALGIRNDAQFRANVGVVNLDDVQHDWRVEVLADDGRSLEMSAIVPPRAMVHLPMPASDLGKVTVTFFLLNAEPDFAWAAYATSNDNVTGDGWVSSAVPLE